MGMGSIAVNLSDSYRHLDSGAARGVDCVKQFKKLRIAFATPEFVTEKYFDGGLQTYLGRVSKALASLGHDVHVVTMSHTDATEFEHEGVFVHRVMLRPGWLLVNRLTRYRVPTILQWLNLSTQVYRKLKTLNAQEPLQLVQFPNHSFCGLLSMMLLRIPHVLRLSSYEPLFSCIQDQRRQRTLDFRLLKLLEKLQLRLSPHIYSPSRYLQRMLSKEDGIDRVRLLHSPMYVETDDWDASVYDQLLKGKNYLLFLWPVGGAQGRSHSRPGFGSRA